MNASTSVPPATGHLTGDYRRFNQLIQKIISSERIITDPLRTLAYGTDASFYRLIPQVVVRVDNEQEVADLLRAAETCQVAVTFRAAGTSLSGQAISDSVLVLATTAWQEREVLDDGGRIRLQPGVIGKHANSILAPFEKKIGPDPASINAAMIGGIAANNASGMCCGTAQNSYKTVAGMRIIFQDGTLLDTADEASRSNFLQKRGDLVEGIEALSREVKANEVLAGRIRDKFKIKNTTGYSLNALVDFTDPIDIITHLMIGSEGTLGFISEITYQTVDEYANKASALVFFPTIREACQATELLRQQPVAAVELMDRPALRSVEDKEGMPEYLKELPEGTTALLVETRAAEKETLSANIESISGALAEASLVLPLKFTDKLEEYTLYWNIRKGLFPAVGAVRETGTTVIIEDVAFPISHLADAAVELQQAMARFNYDGIIFGHALEGNLHFVFTQDFGSQEEIDRYEGLMQEVCTMVVEKYGGSLKAEHGTGRNMAPFVEYEWGRDAYLLMKRIKALFDPNELLNPGVILNANPKAHLENLKPLAATHPLVDKCIECGFCEPQCPSRDITLSPRQRITVQREISRLKVTKEDPDRLKSLVDAYKYYGDATCAADGLCQSACPVGINTGELTKALRNDEVAGTYKENIAKLSARNFAALTGAIRMSLKGVDLVHKLLGTDAMDKIATTARKISGNRLPLWTPEMPKGIKKRGYAPIKANGGGQVVYFPSCISRTMGPSRGDGEQRVLMEITETVLKRAGYGVIYPKETDSLCCGVPFQSKGAFRQADEKSADLERVLLEASGGGLVPILCDTSPCIYRMREAMDKRLRLYEPVEFIHDFILPKLDITPLKETVTIHTTCSSEKMGLAPKFLAVAQACASEVVVPEKVGCCGFAGDRGFTFPELNASALKDLRPAVEGGGAVAGYSNSRTCEIGLSLHSGIHYRSIMYLIEQCSR
ncbi:FAD-binding and (Fe-S)-binding domain-containing protein [Desulfosediminicola ganghwensis]|uniref:FAD-binding and (Fe-S)-binding domain-containing protein n=1 Tax=Desulfosediminicola ganghwensis TaxID=2569540 RepID=UPI0010AC4A1D|nr:FAD-binding and (Fe-S)-binding domain-containing protein [Desulfosediminicola ganghwensis]